MDPMGSNDISIQGAFWGGSSHLDPFSKWLITVVIVSPEKCPKKNMFIFQPLMLSVFVL